VIDERELRAALPKALLRVAPQVGKDPLELALFGGEDYALVATGRPARRPRIARAIGSVERGASGVWLRAERGLRRLGSGFEHSI
jgi:thiamine monophosphate kinase